MSSHDLILVGGGGHCKSVIDVIESADGYRISGILDLEEKLGEQVLSYRIIGTEDMISELASEGKYFVVTIGHLKSPHLRIKTYNRIIAAGGEIPAIFSARAVISSSAAIGRGTVVFHQAVVNAAASIGENCIINTGAIVEHDSTTGDHTHVSTGAIINGGCSLGSRIFIGSGSIIREGLKITDDVLIGAGSIVTRDILEPGTYYGNPARKKN